VGGHRDQGIGTGGAAHGTPDRFGQIPVVLLGDEVGQDLRVGIGCEHRTRLGEFLPQLEEILDDPVVYDRKLGGRIGVWMGIAVGRRLVDEFGASSVILGCAGMAAIKVAAEKKLPVPVIEPAQAAVCLAIESL